jgi:competence protein ComEC
VAGLVAGSASALPIEPAVAGAVYTVGALRLAVLGPTQSLRGTRSDPNNNSLVLHVQAGSHTMLLTGDAEGEQQRTLHEHFGSGLRCDVLKVPHHGSAYQDEAFLAAVDPVVAMVSVGRDNSYGHPNGALLGWLHRSGARVMRTDRDGDVAIVDREGRLAVVARGPAVGDRR